MKRLNLLLFLFSLILVGCSESDDGEVLNDHQRIFSGTIDGNGAYTRVTEDLSTLRQAVASQTFYDPGKLKTIINVQHEEATTYTGECNFLFWNVNCVQLGNFEKAQEYTLNGGSEFFGTPGEVNGQMVYQNRRFANRQAIIDYLLGIVLNSNLVVQIRALPMASNYVNNGYNIAQAPNFTGIASIASAFGANVAEEGAVIYEIAHSTGEIYYFSFFLPIYANPVLEQKRIFQNGVQALKIYRLDYDTVTIQ